MIIRAFLTSLSEIMGRKRHCSTVTRRWAGSGEKEEGRMTKAANKHATANGIPFSRDLGLGVWERGKCCKTIG